MPSGWLGIISIAYIDWYYVAFADATADFIGSIIAFYFSRKYGRKFVKRFVSESKIDEYKSKIIGDKNQFVKLIIIRILTSPVLDFVSYIAGLTKIKASTYLLSTFIGNTFISILFYYLLSLGYKVNTPVFIAVLIVLSILGFVLLRIFNKSKPEALPY